MHILVVRTFTVHFLNLERFRAYCILLNLVGPYQSEYRVSRILIGVGRVILLGGGRRGAKFPAGT